MNKGFSRHFKHEDPLTLTVGFGLACPNTGCIRKYIQLKR